METRKTITFMTNTEKVKYIRNTTLAPINKINDALKKSEGNVDEAIQILIKEKHANLEDMNNRVANTNIVYSYTHNNRIGAMIVLACQSDFVARNELFLALAKNICMHIVSSPVWPEYIKKEDIPEAKIADIQGDVMLISKNKPANIIQKIIDGKITKYCDDYCLLNQKYVKDDTLTIEDLIKDASASLGEKIEIKQFIKMVAQ